MPARARKSAHCRTHSTIAQLAHDLAIAQLAHDLAIA
jgi:hypothetical protein